MDSDASTNQLSESSNNGLPPPTDGSGTAAAPFEDGAGKGLDVRSEASNPKIAGSGPPGVLQPESAQDVNASGRVEPSGQPAEQSSTKVQVFQAYVHLLSPSDQVLSSKDILPLILASLKESFGGSLELCGWQAAFASIIRVSRSFFGVGAALLWHTMTSIGPAFKILPWHDEGSEYRGLGAYRYKGGPPDWDRFLLYSSFIRHVKLQTNSDDTPEAHWVSELHYMPNGPTCLFPNVNTITVGPEGTVAALPLLKMLASNSLQSLDVDITTCDLLNRPEKGVDGKVQAEFPVIHFRASRLQAFRYKGPVGPGFFRRLSLLQSITSLDLEWVNPVSADDLLCLANLRQLRKLHLATPAHVIPLRQDVVTVHGVAVRELKVIGPEMLQSITASIQSHQRFVEVVHLEVTRVDDIAMVIHTLTYYFGIQLESIRVQVLPPWAQQARWPSPIWLGGIPDFDRETRARNSFALASNLKKAAFEGVPSSLWRFMSSVLQGSIGGWKRLTSLTFQIQRIPATTTEPALNYSATFPGLSFLASTIWLECPSLEFLEFHFEHLKLMNEDLSLALENVKNQASPSIHPGGHPLRELIINTGTVAEDGSGLTFNPDRKIEIVAFLEQLFPRLTLDTLRGTPAALWNDMGTWLQTYRKLKEEAATRH